MARREWPIALALVAGLILLVRPYAGIRHDSVLYLGQALALLYPTEFGKDFFFEFGSQSSYTIFPQLIAVLLRHVEAGTAFLWLTLLSRLAFYAASWLLVRRLYPERRMAYFSLLCLAVMPAGYGGLGLISYAEPFFTGRSLAEPMALLSLAFLLAGHRLPALGLWLVAAFIHPLVALPTLVVAWCWLVLGDKRWLYALWLVFPVLIFSYYEVSPFDKLFLVYDPQWFEWVEYPNKFVFVSRWQPAAWCYLATDLFLVWQWWRCGVSPARRYASAVLLATTIGFVASLLLADVLKLVLPTGLQLWRVQWLLHWLAMASLPWVFRAEWHAAASGDRTRLLLLGAIVLAGAPMGAVGAPWPLPLLLALYLAWPRLQAHIGQRTVRFLNAGLVAMMLLSAARFGYQVLHQYRLTGSGLDIFRLDSIIFSYPLFSLVLIGGGGWLWMHRVGWRPLLAICAFSLLLWSVWHWDSRNTRNRMFERVHAESVSPFGVALSPGTQVYWQDELLAPWVALHRPSYYSNQQRAGLLFNRGTAQAAAVRQDVLRVIDMQAQLCTIIDAVTGAGKDDEHACRLDEQTLVDACAESKGGLSYLVLPYRLKTGVLGHWQIPARMTGEKTLDYYLYACPKGNGHAR